MSPADINSLREEVRGALAQLPAGQGATVDFLAKAIRRNTPLRPTNEEVEQALVWNQGKGGWCDFKYNRELEWDEWYLTPRGITKEGLSKE